MRGVARVGDSTLGGCKIHGAPMPGKIISGSSNTTTNDIGAARLGDTVQAACGCIAYIISGAGTYTINYLGAARLNDAVLGPTYSAKIITCSSNVVTED